MANVLYTYNRSLVVMCWDRGWTWIFDTGITIGFVPSVKCVPVRAPGAEHFSYHCDIHVEFLLKCNAACPKIAIKRDMRYFFSSTINHE